MYRTTLRSTLFIVALACRHAAAQHAGDILLLVENDQITTNSFVDGVPSPECSFLGTFGAGDQTNDPGFDSPSETFAPNSSLGFTITHALRVWQGGTFDTIPEEHVELSWGPLGPVATPADDSPVDGFTLGVSSEGEYHYHYKMALMGPNSPGVYLLTLAMWSTSGSIAESEPIYILLNNGMDQATVDLATEWWRNNGAWCSASSCLADFNGDDLVDTRDVLAFLNAWSADDPSADINEDGEIDSRDVLAFLNLWTTGC